LVTHRDEGSRGLETARPEVRLPRPIVRVAPDPGGAPDRGDPASAMSDATAEQPTPSSPATAAWPAGDINVSILTTPTPPTRRVLVHPASHRHALDRATGNGPAERLTA